ncbi:MAG: HEAT repeat domain-containing protein [Candidatus Helarchaeota archaeon]|nr:HEAT repeat domain-containing protein [Candidatus Helarchaeota archaeon]
MKKESAITTIYGLLTISLIIIFYLLLANSIPNIFILSEWTEFLILLCLIFPVITTILALIFYFSLKIALPMVFSGLGFLIFQGIWFRFPIINVLMSSAYFLLGMLFIGLGLWLESDLLPLRYPEAFEDTEEEMPEPMDIQFSEEDYKDEVKFWIKLLDSSDEKYREEAIISLGEIGDKRALPHLEKFLEDDSKTLQKLSKKAIELIKGKSK